LALIDEQKSTAEPPAGVEVRESLLESIASMSVVLVIGLFVMTFIFQNFEIPSASMVKTLVIGDHVLVDRTTLAPQTKWMPLVHYRSAKRGDIIVFLKPHPETPGLILVKRLIGIAGDRIHLRNVTHGEYHTVGNDQVIVLDVTWKLGGPCGGVVADA
jgi:signal peptidase I